MASRIMHLAAAVQLTDLLPQGMDIPRFLSGEIMVDSAPQERKASHFLTCVNDRKTYDVAAFRAQYGHLLLTDGLVLGYYLHLLQDLVFRDHMYHTLGFNPKKPGYLAGLHSDYRRLNHLLIQRYNLSADFPIPANAAPLDGIAAFDMAYLPATLSEDFTLHGAAEAFFFTEAMAVAYIDRAVALCRQEIQALITRQPLTDPMNWTWALDPV